MSGTSLGSSPRQPRPIPHAPVRQSITKISDMAHNTAMYERLLTSIEAVRNGARREQLTNIVVAIKDHILAVPGTIHNLGVPNVRNPEATRSESRLVKTRNVARVESREKVCWISEHPVTMLQFDDVLSSAFHGATEKPFVDPQNAVAIMTEKIVSGAGKVIAQAPREYVRLKDHKLELVLRIAKFCSSYADAAAIMTEKIIRRTLGRHGRWHYTHAQTQSRMMS
ncbi:hypothetical protein LTS10_003963 [Elasticomyces elasticus]|nr:hypothetical protein LTS10_003963 [Elasticomyces elasticus]